MSEYRFIDHTADVQMQIRGETLEALFRAGLAGMNELLKPGFCNDKSDWNEQSALQLESPDRTVLLIDFLSEVLYRSQTHHILYCAVQFEQLHATALKGQLYGREAEGFEEDIKAVTFHGAEVKQDEQGRWSTQIVFDI
jgi:SHS2 domain-containing protein